MARNTAWSPTPRRRSVSWNIIFSGGLVAFADMSVSLSATFPAPLKRGADDCNGILPRINVPSPEPFGQLGVEGPTVQSEVFNLNRSIQVDRSKSIDPSRLIQVD